jgi:signal transduction histidine kinase
MAGSRHEPGTPVPWRPANIGASQRLLRLVLDTLPVGVIVIDLAGDILLANPASSRIWAGKIDSGKERYEKSKGFRHGTDERLRPEEWNSVRALVEGETSLDELIDIETYDGRRKTIRASAAPIRDDHQAIIGAVVVNQDVTERERSEEERARRARQQDSVAQLSLAALKGEGMQPIFDEAVALVARTLDVEHSLVMEARPAQRAMVFRAGVGRWKEEIIGRATVPTAPGFMSWFSMASKAPVVVEDLKGETRFIPCELLLEHGVKSAINVPILGREQPFGVLGAHSTQPRVFKDDETHFVWAMANVLATTIEQKRAAGELQEKREQLQALSRQLIEAQEAERRAIARELHDDFGQVLTAIKLNLMRRPIEEAESISLVDGAIARMRDLAQDLRPPMLDELGLAASLQWYLEREARRAGLELKLEIAPHVTRLPPTVETTSFRVAQEAFTNVIRHAKARRVEVELGIAGDELQLVVRDDGRGFEVSEAQRRARRGESQGLLSMQERAALAGGELVIDSSPGSGTAVRARFPLGGAR